MFSTLVSALALAGAATAASFPVQVEADGAVRLRQGASVPGKQAVAADAYCYGLYPKGTPCPITFGWFEQLIDHDKPEVGTFKQRYWVNNEYYAGPGAPIVLSTPGEGAADGYQTYTMNKTLAGVYAQDGKGAAVVLEHRYWGQSSPVDSLDAKSLQHLTLDQSLRDMVRFAEKVDFPFAKGHGTPDKAPWTFLGGSYPGAMVGYMYKLFPGTFWTYHASSAVVEPIGDYWQYFSPIEQAMPRNCSKDYKLAIKKLDKMLDGKDDAGKKALKAKFGLGDLADDDFGSTLTNPFGTWQSTKFTTGAGKVVLYNMCDYIEGVPHGTENGNKTIPGEEGVGGCKALKGLAQYMREVYVAEGPCDGQYWADGSLACLNTHNLTSPLYTDRTIANKANIQWEWMCCNEPFQHWQAYYPGDTGLISKFFTTQTLRNQCADYFPDTDGFKYGLKEGRTTEQIVEKTTGWEIVNTTRLIYVNGQYDPWREETVSSDFRPGGPMHSTPDAPIFLVANGTHCPELRMQNVAANTELAAQVKEMRSIMAKWTGEFYTEKKIQRPGF